jgi:glycosyltransferase involved in cell wall biosynthesis
VRIKFVSRLQVPDYLTASDAGIFFIKPTFSKTASSPTKHAEFLGCGLPLVCNSQIGDLDQIVKESDTGVIVEAFNEREYLSKSHQLINLIPKYSRKEISEKAKDYYNLEAGIAEYEKIYKLLLSDQ